MKISYFEISTGIAVIPEVSTGLYAHKKQRWKHAAQI
jgi:hypothetical protein